MPNFKIRQHDGKNKMLFYVFYVIAITMCPIQKWSYCSSVYGHIRKLEIGRFNNGNNYFIKNIHNLIKFLQERF